ALSTGISCLAYGTALRDGEVAQRRAAVLDPLTGLLNRAKLDERFEEVRQVAVSRGRTVGLLLCDLDHFKLVNDHHGHAAGDAVLVATAYELRRVLADHELIYRLGGEEFAVVLPDTDLAQATAHAELIRAAVVAARPGGVDVTTSVGVAVGDPAELDFAALFAAADAALYRAKHAGRNRVVAGVLGDAHLREIERPPVVDAQAAAA
ncbi:MAG: GGDEF domain-containing protein, partial [Solirubrobacteraceae bacterium]|nr:GGDEF domain-containing protein [Solirubrobacteraceae bacterium]